MAAGRRPGLPARYLALLSCRSRALDGAAVGAPGPRGWVGRGFSAMLVRCGFGTYERNFVLFRPGRQRLDDRSCQGPAGTDARDRHPRRVAHGGRRECRGPRSHRGSPAHLPLGGSFQGRRRALSRRSPPDRSASTPSAASHSTAGRAHSPWGRRGAMCSPSAHVDKDHGLGPRRRSGSGDCATGPAE